VECDNELSSCIAWMLKEIVSGVLLYKNIPLFVFNCRG